DNTVRVWEVPSGREVKCFRGHATDVRSVAVAPGGRRVLSGDRGGLVYLWDTVADKEVAVLRGHREYVHGVLFLPGGRPSRRASTARSVCGSCRSSHPRVRGLARRVFPIRINVGA